MLDFPKVEKLMRIMAYWLDEGVPHEEAVTRALHYWITRLILHADDLERMENKILVAAIYINIWSDFGVESVKVFKLLPSLQSALMAIASWNQELYKAMQEAIRKDKT